PLQFTGSDGQAVLPANYIFTGGDAGVHTFNATLKTAGTQSITVTDTVSGSVTGTQAGITVDVAGASKLAFTTAAQARTATVPSGLVSVEWQDGGHTAGNAGGRGWTWDWRRITARL